MIVRPLAADEVHLVFVLASDALAENPRMGTAVFNPSVFVLSVAPVIANGSGVLLGAFGPHGSLVGALFATSYRDPLTGVVTASEHLVSVFREFRGLGVSESLSDAFEEWAVGVGARFLQQHVCHGGDDRGTMLEAKGYENWDRHYAKVV